LDYELFGEVPKIVPAGIFVGGPGLGVGVFPATFAGGSIFGGGSVFPAGSGFGGGLFGPPMPMSFPAPSYKRPPIKYATVSFPYSSKPKSKEE
jgi:hypothetical protein